MTTIGVDVGGTFTDLVSFDTTTKKITVAKHPTTPAAPERGVLAAVDAAVGAAGLARCEYFVHGTTVGLNALLERRGAAVGLITTEGFRDVLEIRRGDRDDPYDLFWTPPPPLVPRRLRQEVAERVAADGSVVRPLDPAGVRRAAAAFAAEGVGTVAVVLINAYANPAHEHAVLAALRSSGFTGEVSLSHEVSGEYREYERTTTTVVDALVRHRMGPYLHNLDHELRTRGFTGKLLVTRSGGGALTLEEAAKRPFETILSGPVAGATATAHLAHTLGLVPAPAGSVAEPLLPLEGASRAEASGVVTAGVRAGVTAGSTAVVTDPAGSSGLTSGGVGGTPGSADSSVAGADAVPPPGGCRSGVPGVAAGPAEPSGRAAAGGGAGPLGSALAAQPLRDVAAGQGEALGAFSVPHGELPGAMSAVGGQPGVAAGVGRVWSVGEALGLSAAIAADVGGTSFDTALIEDGRLPLLFQGQVTGLPLQCPWVDVRSVGAGGGSVAYVDVGGLLRVGPRSAGAVPGPACYRRGGGEPTVTDAALHLGLILPGHLAGGVDLAPGLAEAALAPLAAPAGLPGTDAVAEGVLRIAAAHMAQAVRGVTVERGVDPRRAALVAFGGAGPLFGCLLADELGLSAVVVPPNAGNFSAAGLIQADLVRSTARTLLRPLSDPTLKEALDLAETLLTRLTAPYGEAAQPEQVISVLHEPVDGPGVSTGGAGRRSGLAGPLSARTASAEPVGGPEGHPRRDGRERPVNAPSAPGEAVRPLREHPPYGEALLDRLWPRTGSGEDLRNSGEHPPAGEAVREVDLDLRHQGQEHTLTVRVAKGESAAEVRAAFTGAYRRAFGHELPGPLEIVTVRATLRVPRARHGGPLPAPPEAGEEREIDVWSFRRRARVRTRAVPRSALTAPEAGPLVVTEPTATTYVDEGFAVRPHPSGVLLITREETT
ncbi:hydantoinase/oxoprolinase family protein [Sinosporangium siamense]|uniref:N-methylhydantoinase A n=1 Tax=Sinosporangium siamense TaxID=1367973 RepID=A0A919V7Y4_9ACTN|nr:hydantoinase/oxoprolinase family protein [Sinosporangium siamense]GII93903.1 hypothetical protein Ssi02_41340 [Sinosporangium siamense]